MGLIPGSGRPLEQKMVIHFSILAWKTPWTEEPTGYGPRGHKGLDTTERLSTHTYSKEQVFTFHSKKRSTQLFLRIMN